MLDALSMFLECLGDCFHFVALPKLLKVGPPRREHA
jgi:hypothetical protein